jgi:hypothetical protein
MKLIGQFLYVTGAHEYLSANIDSGGGDACAYEGGIPGAWINQRLRLDPPPLTVDAFVVHRTRRLLRALLSGSGSMVLTSCYLASKEHTGNLSAEPN